MGNAGNEGFANSSAIANTNGKSSVHNEKLEKSWKEGRCMFHNYAKGKEHTLPTLHASELVAQLTMLAKKHDILIAISGHFIFFFEIFTVAMGEYESQSLNNIGAIACNVLLWFIRTETLFAATRFPSQQPEFLLCLKYLTQTLYSMAKCLKRICGFWKTLGVKREAIAAHDEDKLINKGSTFVYLFDKLCICARNCCRDQSMEATKLTELQELYEAISPSRFDLDFFAEANYRSSRQISASNEVHTSVAQWLYKEQVHNNRSSHDHIKPIDSVFLLYGTPCSGKSKFAVDLALNVRAQSKLLAAYFMHPYMDGHGDHAECFVRSVAYQCAVNCPQLRPAILKAVMTLQRSDHFAHRGGGEVREGGVEATRLLHRYLIGTNCSSRAVDLWDKLVIGPWNGIKSHCVSPRNSQPAIKGILKNATSESTTSVDETMVERSQVEKGMVIIIDGFMRRSDKMSTPFSDSIANFLVHIYRTLPEGLRIIVCANRDSDFVASCRLPKSVAESIFSDRDRESLPYDSNYSIFRESPNPIHVYSCLDLDPLATTNVLNITHGKCNCPVVSSDAICRVCSRHSSRVASDSSKNGVATAAASDHHSDSDEAMFPFGIKKIVSPCAVSLLDVLLAGRSGRNSILYISLSINGLISHFRGSSNVPYEALCQQIPQNMNDLFRREMEKIIDRDKALFHHVGKLMIMFICHAERPLSVAEVAWLLQATTDTVLLVADRIRHLFPLVRCGLPVDSSRLNVDAALNEVIYSDSLSEMGPSQLNNSNRCTNVCQQHRGNDVISSPCLNSRSKSRPSAATVVPAYSGEIEHAIHGSSRRISTQSIATHIEEYGEEVEISEMNNHRRDTANLFHNSGSSQLHGVGGGDMHTTYASSVDGATTDGNAASIDDDHSPIDLTSDKAGLRSLKYMPPRSDPSIVMVSHSDEDLHQYFYAIHPSLIAWCRDQKHIFPSEVYGRTFSRHSANNCSDAVVASLLNISRWTSPRASPHGCDSSLAVRQAPGQQLMFGSYGYGHLLTHISNSLNYRYLSPCMYFSIAWMLGAAKATSWDKLLQDIDMAARDEWVKCNARAKDDTRKLVKTPISMHSAGSKDHNNSDESRRMGYRYENDQDERHRYYDPLHVSSASSHSRLYYSLRLLWLCLRRGYWGLQDAVSSFRNSSTKETLKKASDQLEKELCFHIINWLSPFSAVERGHSVDVASAAIGHSGNNSSISNASVSMGSDEASSLRSDLSHRTDELCYIDGLVKAAERLNSSGQFTHSIPRIVYPIAQGGMATDAYLTNNSESRVILSGHSNKVVGLCSVEDVTNGREYFASSSDDCTVRIWNSVSNSCDTVFCSHAGGITCMQPLPYGLLASGSLDLTIHILCAMDKSLKHKLVGHDGVVNCMALMQQQQLLVSGSEDRSVRVWNYFEGGSPVMVLTGHRKAITSLLAIDVTAFSKAGDSYTGKSTRNMNINEDPIGCILLSGSADKTVRSWNMETGRLEKVFKGHTERVVSIVGPFLWNSVQLDVNSDISGAVDSSGHVSFTAENFRFCSAQDDNVVIIWSYVDAAILFQITGSPITYMLDLPSDRLATASADKVIAIWSVDKCHREHFLRGHTKKITSLARVTKPMMGANVMRGSVVDFADSLLCSGSDDCSVLIWNTYTGDCLYRYEGPSQPITCVLLSVHFGRVIASCGCWDGSVHRWFVGTRREINCLESNGDSNLKPSTNSANISQHSNRVTSICPIGMPSSCYGGRHTRRDGKDITLFGSSSLDGTIRLWAFQRTDIKASASSELYGNVYEANEDPDGCSLCCIAVLQCDRVSDICFLTQLTDGRLVVSGLENTIVVYPFPSAEISAAIISSSCSYHMLSSVKSISNIGALVIKGLTCRVTSLTSMVGPVDGAPVELLITGSDDYLIRLYDIQSGVCVRALDGHTDSITCIQSLADGRLLSGSHDGSVCLWNLNTRQNTGAMSQPKAKYKPYISMLKGKHSINAMFIFKPNSSGAMLPMGAANVKPLADVQLCIITSDGVIHMREIDSESIASMEHSKAQSAGSKIKMATTKEVLADNNVNIAGNEVSAHYPVMHQLLAKGKLYGIMDAYSFKGAIGHHVSDYLTTGYSMQPNILVAGTLFGELYMFRVFDKYGTDIMPDPITSVSPVR